MSNNQLLIEKLPGANDDNELCKLLLGIGAILNDIECASRIYEKIRKINPDLEAVEEFRQSLYNALSILYVLGKKR